MQALSSVLGGGGLANIAMSVAGIAFPPLGIATSLANIVSQGVGQAVNMATQQLQQTAGMPKFLADMIGQAVGKVMDQMHQGVDPACQQHCDGNSGVQNWKDDFVQDLCKSLVDKVKEDMCGHGKSGGASGKKAGSWLEALARALGEAAGEKAGKMVDLSNQISGLSGDSSPEAAKQMTALNSELSGVSKIFSLMQETLNTTVKSIGEGLSTVARKQ